MKGVAALPLCFIADWREERYHEVCGNCKSWHKVEGSESLPHSNTGDAYPLSYGACGCDMAKAIIHQKSKNESGGKKITTSFDTWSDSDACTQYRNAEREEFRVGRKSLTKG